MNRIFCNWLVLAAVLAGICESPAPLHAQKSDTIDLAEITQRLQQWRGSFVNLRMVYELRSLPTTTSDPLIEWPAPEDPTIGRLFARKEWIWADHGLNLTEVRYYHMPGGSRIIDVFNGPKGAVFRANYKQTPEGQEELKELSLRGLGVGKGTSSSELVPLRGLYWPGRAMWLPDLLSEWKWTVEAIEEVGGERCARITTANPDFTDVAWTHVLWVDLNHDGLVRRNLMPSIPKRRPQWDFVVDEFQRLENGIWFPKRGRLQLGGNEYENQLWEVTEVAVNHSLDLARFDPPRPVVGTLVDDGKGRVYTHGVTSPVKSSRGQPNTIGGSTPRQSSAPSATPPRSRWIWWSGGLMLVSIVCLSVGFWLSHRRKWLAVVIVLVGISGSPTRGFAQNTDTIDLAEITQRLKQWRGSFVNLRMVYELRSLPTTTAEPLTDWPAPEDTTTGKLFLRKEWIWADHGLDLFANLGPSETSGPWLVEVFNGPRGVVFRANYKQTSEGAKTLAQLTLRGLGSGKPTSSLRRVPMDGLYWPGTANWLTEKLEEWKWKLEGIEEIAGERCARIVAADPFFTDIDWLHILWLDLNHDCLVRRHLSPEIAGQPERRSKSDFIVDELQRLESGVWFPKRGRFQFDDNPYQNQSWQITEVALNQSLDLSRFEPPQPVVGTIVDDGKGHVYKHGVTAGVNPLQVQPNAVGGSSPQRSPASPPTSAWIWWSGGLLCLSLLFFGGGFWFWHHKSEDR